MATFIRNRSRLVFLLSAGLAGSLVLAATAYALTASSFKYSSPKTGYLRVSHMDFIANNNGSQWSQSLTTGLTTAANSCFNAGVDLPVGAKVKTVTWFYQSGATRDFEGSFRMNQLGTGVGSPDHRARHPRRRFRPSNKRHARGAADAATREGRAGVLGRGVPGQRRGWQRLFRSTDQVHVHLGRLLGHGHPACRRPSRRGLERPCETLVAWARDAEDRSV